MTRPARVRRLLRPLALAAAAAAACAHPRAAETVCPEYRNLACMTAPECSMDRARGCQVCQCRPSAAGKEAPLPPSGVPPDRR